MDDEKIVHFFFWKLQLLIKEKQFILLTNHNPLEKVGHKHIIAMNWFIQ